jgi:putative heme-binding domain-containing protein
LLAQGPTDRSRAGALWLLRNLDALSVADLRHALSDRSSRVREQAVRVAEPRLGSSPELLQSALSLAGDDDPRVRFQLAFALGAVKDPASGRALSRIARRSAADPWIRTAVLSSSASFAADILIDLMADTPLRSSAEGAQLVRSLLSVCGARARDDEVARVVLAISRLGDRAEQRSCSQALGDGLRRAGRDLDPGRLPPGPARELLTNLFAEASRAALDPDTDPAAREPSIRLLACAPWTLAGETLTALLDPTQPEAVQAAAIQGMARRADAAVTACLLDRWRTFTPGVRPAAIDAMLGRKERTLALLRLAAQDPAVLATLHPAHRGVIRQSDDPEIAAMASQVFGVESRGDRERVVAAYRRSLALPRDPGRGEAVFRRECAACHRIGSVGHAVGPNLASSSNREPDALLVHILDPNRYVMPEHLLQQISDVQGRIVSGLIAGQTATSLTLLREEGQAETVLRKDIAQSVVTDRSLMPEGLESRIPPEEMADLLAFLLDAQRHTSEGPPPLGIGTPPGLVEPEAPGR